LPLEHDIHVAALATPGTPLPDGVETVAIARRAPGRFAGWEHEMLLPSAIRRGHGTVFHSPAQDPPRNARIPWAQTLLDLIPLAEARHPLRRRFERHGARYRQAEAVIAISHHSATEGIRRLGLDAARVHVAWLGVDPSYHPAPVADDVAPYVLAVGEYEARKRLDHAFEVVGRLADDGYPHRLLLAGRVAPWRADALRTAVSASRHPDRIDVLGHVDDLAAVYRGASALLHTSSYEGFGLPVVEAMASGTPVVAYANSAVPEIAGDAALLIEDGDIDGFVAATRSILGDSSRAADLSAAGLQRAKVFSWNDCVAIHADVYRAIAGV
jgi:alpha-1,3-rhamnosyl/mannosyltransferase